MHYRPAHYRRICRFEQNDWVHSISAFNASYSDAGLLGAHGTVGFHDAERFCDTVVGQLEAVAKGVSSEDASRAVAKAKTALALSCEGHGATMQVRGPTLNQSLGC